MKSGVQGSCNRPRQHLVCDLGAAQHGKWAANQEDVQVLGIRQRSTGNRYWHHPPLDRKIFSRCSGGSVKVCAWPLERGATPAQCTTPACIGTYQRIKRCGCYIWSLGGDSPEEQFVAVAMQTTFSHSAEATAGDEVLRHCLL